MNRTQLMKVIHVARRELRLDETTYRQLLKTHCGSESLRAMSDAQLARIFAVMKRQGFKVTSKEPPAYDKQAAMIRALWLELATSGEVRDGSSAALNKFVSRQTNIARLEWLNNQQASQVIEQLKKWLTRIGRR
ncbi:gp16 family protein [Salmonella enterica]|uniref:gp16 family protein n=1 Tax=Salmonella enterica TaxID=28901 RepID=UPI0003BD7DD8|nr:regulatory protein GemA [Salmonella enterica]APV88270.1 GemA protein [Salmonella enterica subsp. enterica serovar Mbandaka str. ATCC 51958]EBF8302797.1 regulatory protein GemA [Salmonella enterica subsp. enterica serovar Mbandaka]